MKSVAGEGGGRRKEGGGRRKEGGGWRAGPTDAPCAKHQTALGSQLPDSGLTDTRPWDPARRARPQSSQCSMDMTHWGAQ